MPLAIASLPRQLVYVTALELGVARLKTLPLSVRLVRELHEELMTRMRGDHATPGESRRSQSWDRPARLHAVAGNLRAATAQGDARPFGRMGKFLHDETLPPLVQTALI